ERVFCRRQGVLVRWTAPSRDRSMHRREFIAGAALAAMALPLAGMRAASAAPGSRLLPVPLRKGDTVALVSPSSATDERINLQLAQEAMEALGFRVKAGAHYASRYGHL